MPFLLRMIPSKLILSCLMKHFSGFNFKPAFLHRLIISHMLVSRVTSESLYSTISSAMQIYSVANFKGLVDAGLKNCLGRFESKDHPRESVTPTW